MNPGTKKGSGSRVEDLGLRVQGLGFRVQGFRVQDLAFQPNPYVKEQECKLKTNSHKEHASLGKGGQGRRGAAPA